MTKPTATRRDNTAAVRGNESSTVALPGRPWLLAAGVALLLARAFYPSESAAYEGDGQPVVLGWLLLGLVWLVLEACRARATFRLARCDVALVALIACLGIATLAATYRGAPRPAWNTFWEWSALAFGFFLMRQWVAGPRECRGLVVLGIAAATLVACYGMYQSLYEMPATRAEYARDPDALLRSAGMWTPPGSPQRELLEKRLANQEPLGTFALTNSLAGYLAAWLTPWLAVLMTTRCFRDETAPRTRRLAIAGATAAALILLACLVATHSRSGYVAAAIGLLTAALAIVPRRLLRYLLLTTMLLGVVGGLLLFFSNTALTSAAARSLGYRFEYWHSTCRMIAQRPFFGCGPGNFQYEYTRYKLPAASEEVADPHNFLLEVWATAGTPAAIALVALLVSVMLGAARGKPLGNDVAKSVERPKALLVAGGLGALVCGVATSQLSSAAPDAFALSSLALAAIPIVLSLRCWVDRGSLHPWIPLVAIITLLVHLTTSGGIAFAGVAGSLWLWLALAVISSGSYRTIVIPRAAVIAAACALAAIVAAHYTTTSAPVREANLALQQASIEPRSARQWLTAAAEADRWSATPWMQLAAIDFARWRAAPTDANLAAFQRDADQWLRRSPNQSYAWLAVADYYLAAYQVARAAPLLNRALECYAQAAALYPNDATHRAKYAVALALAGKRDEAVSERAQALQLDQTNPHPNKKLPGELREQLRRME